MARACECAYPMINDELGSDDYRPPRRIRRRWRRLPRRLQDVRPPHRRLGRLLPRRPQGAERSSTRRSTRRRATAGAEAPWLVKGRSTTSGSSSGEPGNWVGSTPRLAQYNRSYRVTAAFLAYLVAKYDREIVRRSTWCCGTANQENLRQDNGQNRAGSWTRSGGPACAVKGAHDVPIPRRCDPQLLDALRSGSRWSSEIATALGPRRSPSQAGVGVLEQAVEQPGIGQSEDEHPGRFTAGASPTPRTTPAAAGRRAGSRRRSAARTIRPGPAG